MVKEIIKGVIIYGAGNAGKQVCDLILKKNKKGVYCFIDKDIKKIGKKYKSIKILSEKNLIAISEKYIIPNIIIAIPSINNHRVGKLYENLNKISQSIYNLPLKTEYNTSRINLNDLQRSEYFKIFSTKSFKLSNQYFNSLKKKNILITGAGGSIGSELVFQLSRISNRKIICLDSSELFLFNLKNNNNLNQKKIKLILGNINDKFLIKQIIKKENINLIFHSAAYKHLNFLEQNPKQAIENNILGTLNLIDSCNSFKNKKIKIINISTDKAVYPTSILGLSKRIAEIICLNKLHDKNSKLNICNVRFGNVFGSKGSVINLFLDKINSGDQIEITSKNVKRFFMSINQACNLVIAASQQKYRFKTFIFDMGHPVKIYDLLKKMIKLKRNNYKSFQIKIVETGLKKGEKITEQLSFSRKKFKTGIKNIFTVNEPKYDYRATNKLIEEIKSNMINNNTIKAINIIKTFLKYEIKKK